MEATPVPPALRQQPPLLPSVRSPSPTWPNLHHQTLLQSPNLSLQLPALPSPNLSLPQPLPRTPPRTPQLHLVPHQPPPQRPFQTGIHQPPRSQPGRREATMSGLRRRSGQRACQSEFQKDFLILIAYLCQCDYNLIHLFCFYIF